MKVVNEDIAKRANAEDDCTGHFWEARFKSNALLDTNALLACMAYVDLNPMRAGIADCVENSEFTTIAQRISCKKIAEPQPIALATFSDECQQDHAIPCSFQEYLELVTWTAQFKRRKNQSSNTCAAFKPLHLATQAWLTAATQFEQCFSNWVDSSSINKLSI